MGDAQDTGKAWCLLGACGGHGKKPYQGDPDVNAFLVALRLEVKSKVLADVASLKATFLGLHVTASHCVLLGYFFVYRWSAGMFMGSLSSL